MIENYTLILYKGDNDLPCYECPLLIQCDSLTYKIFEREFYSQEEKNFFYSCVKALLKGKPLIPVFKNGK